LKNTILQALGILAIMSSSVYADGINDNWSNDYSKVKYVSASSIEKLDKNIDGILPEVNDSNAIYLSPNGPLSKYGPIGPNGPLGKDGPIETKTSYDLNLNLYPYLDKYYKSFFGPLNKDGPLGENGPYTEKSYYSGTLFLDNNFAVHLRSLGLWGILGPTGPLGPVGALGPLGPNGTHGYKKNKNGEYKNKNGKVITKISVPFDNDTSRSFDLFEYYKDEEFAKGKKNLDTSFVTKGDLSDNNLYDEYIINNDDQQIVSILVLPTHLFNNFNIELYDSKKQLIAKSDSLKYINFIQFLAPKYTVYTIKITTSDKSNEYMLYVTGSTEYLNKYNISGDHIASK